MTRLAEVATQPATRRPPRRRRAAALLLAAVVAAAFVGYLQIARSLGGNADGASNSLQAWDMLHGNVLLAHWTVSDVSFYSTELVEQALVEMVTGLHPTALQASAALTYTLIVVLAALLARGRATGLAAGVRMAVAVAFLLVPEPGPGQAILLTNPDHTGTAVPLLITWLVLDRARHARWLPVWIMVLLAWGIVGDPLVMVIGALPLAVVAATRLVAARAWRAAATPLWRQPDSALLIAAVASVVLAKAVESVIAILGGYRVQPLTTGFAPWSALGAHLSVTRDSVAALYGAYLPYLHGVLATVLGIAHLVGIGFVAAAIVLIAVRTVRSLADGVQRAGRVDQILACAAVVLLVAYVVSKLAHSVMSGREIAPLLPFGAVLVARNWVPSSLVLRRRDLRRPAPLALGAVAALLAGALAASFVTQASRPPRPIVGQPVADWLAARHLYYGLGGYWVSNSISLASGGRVRVLPITGGTRIHAYRWETRSDWYEPARYDARFIVIDEHAAPGFGTVQTAEAQFGPPVLRERLASSPGRTVTVLVYEHNLLAGLPAWCALGKGAPSIADC